MLKRWLWIFLLVLQVKSKTKINYFSPKYYCFGVCEYDQMSMKYIYEIYLSIVFFFVIIKSYSFTNRIGGFKHILKLICKGTSA